MRRFVLTLATLLGGCRSVGAPPTATTDGALRTQTNVVYYHPTFAAGPSLVTRQDGTILDERRYEPFGAGIDVDFTADPHNILNKETDASTKWSDHGARWMAPETARWLTPDPPVKAPDPKFMLEPWTLHPYQYVEQNPVQFWDPDGRQSAYGEMPTMGADKAAERMLEQRRQRAAAVAAARARIRPFEPGATKAPEDKDGVLAADVTHALDFNSTQGELKAGLPHFWRYWGATEIRDAAHDAAEEFAHKHGINVRSNGGSTAADAFQHAYASYRMTVRYSAAYAKELGDAHEVSSPNSSGERAKDLWNNAVGRWLALRDGSNADEWRAFDVVEQAWRDGLLRTGPFITNVKDPPPKGLPGDSSQ